MSKYPRPGQPSLIPKVGLLIDRFQQDVRKRDLVWPALTKMVRVWREDMNPRRLIAHPGN